MICSSSSFKKSFIAFIIIFSSLTLKSQIVINEIFLSNGSYEIIKPQYNYLNWIELYNAGTTNKSGTFYLTDDSTNLKKYSFYLSSFAPGAFKVFYFTGIKTNTEVSFKPDADGGSLFLSNSSGAIVDETAYGKQFYNTSYGRVPDGIGNYQYLLTPTRLAGNSLNFASNRSINVLFSHGGGFYASSFNLVLTNTLGNGSIYYTIDGSEPGMASKKYTSPIAITKNTVILACIIETDKIPGNISTQTYFINQRKPDMKVISISTAPANLFDNTIGIYVQGTNGITLNCSDGPRNWNRDWERSANFELFNKSQIQVCNQNLGMRIAGGCSRGNAQKSLAITARSTYGKGRMDYPFFTNRSATNYNSLLLRNGGNDFGVTLFRDAMMQKLSDRFMNIEHQEMEPAVIFMNGEYYGIQCIYERSGEDLIEDIYGLKQEEIQMGEGEGLAIQGSVADYSNLLSFVNDNSLTIQKNFDKVDAEVDLDNFIEYYIFQCYLGNWDWPGNNCKYWRRISPKSKWRYVAFDTDFGFGLLENGAAYYNMLELITTINYGWPNYEWSTRLFRKLIENEKFKQKFINRFYAHINTSFKPATVIATIDSFASLLSKELPFHSNRWGSPAIDNWNWSVENMRVFANQRPEFVRQHLRDILGAGIDVSLSCRSGKPGYGYLSVDKVITNDTAFKGIFQKGATVEIEFIPAPGYQFKKAIKKSNSNKRIQFVAKGDSWKYFDRGDSLTDDWKNPFFDDGSWQLGMAQFGYGEGDEATTISFGADANNKFISSYFRKTFDFDSSSTYSDFNLNILVDDGAVVYLNGKELLRQRIANGIVDYSTLAAGADLENVFDSYAIDNKLFVNGPNVLAVEVHQNLANSSDISFDFEMYATQLGSSTDVEIFKNRFIDTLSENIDFIVYFEEIAPIADILINEISANNKTYADEYGETDDWFEIYNYGNDSVNLSGLFLTDSLPNPLKYIIPRDKGENIFLAPGEYKVIWTDKQLQQGPLHVNFKLSSGGEQLGFYQKVGNSILVLDAVGFESMKTFQSFGRFPNITGSFKNLYVSTPKAENLDLPSEIRESSPSIGIAKIIYLSQNHSISIQLNNSKTTPTTSMQISDLSGRILKVKTINGTFHRESLAHLKKGLYFVTVGNNEWKSTSKIVVH